MYESSKFRITSRNDSAPDWIESGMAVRIESQQAMRQVTRAVTFCYLCGRELGDESVSQTEHLWALRRMRKPRADENPWPATLSVHKDCESLYKSSPDHALTLIQRVFQTPDAELDNRTLGQIKRRIRPGSDDVPDTITIDDAKKAVWHSVRGFHAALYREYLPADVSCTVLPPSPGFSINSNEPIESQLARQEVVSKMLLTAMSVAIWSDEWDGITAWMGELWYRCIWHIPSKESQKDPICFWVIATPETLRWAESLTGGAIPWRGGYRAARVPISGTVLSQEAIDKWNSRNHGC